MAAPWEVVRGSKWLRAVAKEGFDAAAGGEYAAVNSKEELDAFLTQIHEEVSAEVAGEGARFGRL